MCYSNKELYMQLKSIAIVCFLMAFTLFGVYANATNKSTASTSSGTALATTATSYLLFDGVNATALRLADQNITLSY